MDKMCIMSYTDTVDLTFLFGWSFGSSFICFISAFSFPLSRQVFPPLSFTESELMEIKSDHSSVVTPVSVQIIFFFWHVFVPCERDVPIILSMIGSVLLYQTLWVCFPRCYLTSFFVLCLFVWCVSYLPSLVSHQRPAHSTEWTPSKRQSLKSGYYLPWERVCYSLIKPLFLGCAWAAECTTQKHITLEG